VERLVDDPLNTHEVICHKGVGMRPPQSCRHGTSPG
jgi:hypothetical protein